MFQDSSSPADQQFGSADRPASGAFVYNRTVLWKNRPTALANPSVHQRVEPHKPPTIYRHIIHWTEGLCLELIQFFGAWYQRHIDMKWTTINPSNNLSTNDHMAYISGKGMSPVVYVLLKNTIETERHIENPPIIVADPDVEISGTLAACASFLAKGLEAEMQARAAKNVDV
ncbi:hypothetical protein H4Q26_017380 [Puccinia striiformis f. sp. tritici PST-130]|nr:hypothetical protein H4Q26_017380 [Puccinia striiformis f. sp. tritici PST-130]